MYCSKCGTEVPSGGGFCPDCGTQVVNQAPVPQPSNSNNLSEQQPSVPEETLENTTYAESPYAQRLHKYGSSGLFLTGVIMFSAGLVNTMIEFFNNINSYYNVIITSLFVLPIILLPFIGLWLIVSASFSPKNPEKSIPALGLFKAPIIITFIGETIVLILLLILTIIVFISSNTRIGAFCLLGTILFYTYCVMYIQAAMNVFEGIQDGIMKEKHIPNSTVGLFSTLICLSAGFGLFITIAPSFLYSIISDGINELLWQIPGGFGDSIHEAIMGYLYPSRSGMVLNLFYHVGTILCVVSLNLFNNSLAKNRL